MLPFQFVRVSSKCPVTFSLLLVFIFVFERWNDEFPERGVVCCHADADVSVRMLTFQLIHAHLCIITFFALFCFYSFVYILVQKALHDTSSGGAFFLVTVDALCLTCFLSRNMHSVLRGTALVFHNGCYCLYVGYYYYHSSLISFPPSAQNVCVVRLSVFVVLI